MIVASPLVDQVRAALVGREAEIVAALLPDGVGRGREWWALNPSRPDTHLGSFSVAISGERVGQWHDFAGGESGDLFDLVRIVTGADFNSAVRYLARAAGMNAPDPRLTLKRPKPGAVVEWKRREQSGESRGRGCRIVDLAAAKALPPSFLQELGLTELPARAADGDRPAWPTSVVIPYRDASGATTATRFRSDVVAKLGSFWKRGAKPIPYGIDRLRGDETAVWLVEGESDCWCLWHADVAAIGIPGASMWADRWAELLPASAVVNVVQEPDVAGLALVERLRRSPLASRLRVVRLPVKDPADLWCQDPDPERFRAAIAKACAAAETVTPSVKPVAAERPSALPAIMVRTHADRQRERMTPGPMIIDGLLPEGGIGAIIAAPAVGKTLAAIALAEAVAGGTDFAGHRTTQGAVLYAATDAPASTERRLLALPESIARLIMTATDVPELPAQLTALRDAILCVSSITGIPVRLVVLDTYDSIREHSGGGYSDQDGLAEAIMRGLRSIAAELHLGVIIVHHATRGDAGRARGTIVFDARCDWIALAEQTDPGVVTLRSIKCRDGEQGPVGAWAIMPMPVGERSVPSLRPLTDAYIEQAAETDRALEQADRQILDYAWQAARDGKSITARQLAPKLGKGTGWLTRAAERLRKRGLMAAESYEPTPAGIAWLQGEDATVGTSRGGGT